MWLSNCHRVKTGAGQVRANNGMHPTADTATQLVLAVTAGEMTANPEHQAGAR